ncbi:MAG: serine hydrolase [Leptolyngbya sp. IPPAS B-1204]|nr:serine hydrolase [Elainella sp. C42_A2020_010]
MLDFPRRPKGLQRRLARKRSDAQAQTAASRQPRRGPRPLPPDQRRTSQAPLGAADSQPRQRERHSQNLSQNRHIPPTDVRQRQAASRGHAPDLRGRPQQAQAQQAQTTSKPRPGDAHRKLTTAKSATAAEKRLPARALPKDGVRKLQPSGLGSERSESARSARPRTSPLVYLVRLLIVGVGVGAIMGTVISIWDPNLRGSTTSQVTDPTRATQSSEANRPSGQSSVQANVSSVRVGREMSDVVVKATPLVRNLTDLVPGVYVMDIDNGDFFSFNGNATFSAASMIKLPVLIAFFQDVDAGKIKLDEMLQIQQTDVAEGSGDMQYAGVGTQYSALETATNMIVSSDNTATNMVIRRLGGIQALNQRFRQWGLQQTLLRKPLPDLEGTNTTSPKELASLMALLNDGKLISMKSRDRAFEIMRRTANDSLLPSVMSPGSAIAHKTGDIGSMLGDIGLVDLPSGRRYAIATMVKRPHNDARAQDLIRQIAAIVYEHFGGQPVLVPSPIPSPAQTVPQQPIAPTMPAPAGVPSPGMQQPIPQPSPIPQTGNQPGIMPSPAAPIAPGPQLAAPSPVAPGMANPEIEQPAPIESEAANPEPEADPSQEDAEVDANLDPEDGSSEAIDMTFLPATLSERGWGGSR